MAPVSRWIQTLHEAHDFASKSVIRIARHHVRGVRQFDMPRMWHHLGRNLKAPGMEGLYDWFLRNGFGKKLISA